MTHPITDITIIGGGPTGLFASFYAGMRGATAQIVDALPELGGQLTALYPEKYIFDVGAFAPRRLPQACAEPWYGRGIFDRVSDPEEFRDQSIVIIGGGDSAFDWAQQLRERAKAVTLVHRSDRYRAHGATVADVQSAATAGRTTLLPFHELADVLSNGDTLTGVTLREVKTKATR